MIFCLICVNIIIVVYGGSMAGLGVWMFSSGTSHFELLVAIDSSLKSGISMDLLAQVVDRGGLMKTLAIAITFVGIAAMAAACLGIVALIQRSTLFATIYKLSILVLLLCHSGVTLYLTLSRVSLETEIKSLMLTNQEKYFVARTRYFNASSRLQQTVTKFYEHLHIALACCGTQNLHDISESPSFRKSLDRDPSFKPTVPDSCCEITNKAEALKGQPTKLVDINCPYTSNSTTQHKEPCASAVNRVIRNLVLPVLLVCGFFAVVLASALGMMAAEMCSGLKDSGSDTYSENEEEADSDDGR